MTGGFYYYKRCYNVHEQLKNFVQSSRNMFNMLGIPYWMGHNWQGGNNMPNIYENILSGLKEAIDDSVAQKKTLKRRMVTIVPVKEYSSKEVKKIRNNTGLSQK